MDNTKLQKTEKGWLISLEGFECTGKSTLARSIQSSLESDGIQCIVTREPGGTALGEEVRSLLFSMANNMAPSAETLLFYAARVDHVESVIRPAVAEGKVVICDRYYDSTLAYQGAIGAQLPSALNAFLAANNLLPEPDATLMFDTDIETYHERKGIRGIVPGEETNTFEDLRGVAYHTRVIDSFRKIAKENPHRCHVIDARRSFEQVESDTLDTVYRVLRNANIHSTGSRVSNH